MGDVEVATANLKRWTPVFLATTSNKPVFQTKDGVDVLIYFWNDTANPTFCGWWYWSSVELRLVATPVTGNY